MRFFLILVAATLFGALASPAIFGGVTWWQYQTDWVNLGAPPGRVARLLQVDDYGVWVEGSLTDLLQRPD